MTVEYFGGDAFPRLLVTVEASELEGYGVTYSAMSPEDGPTRALLSELLSLVTAMGLRKKGQRLRVDCVSTRGGGCALLISRAESREYVFESSDDIISAYLAGVLPEGFPTREGERWIFHARNTPDPYIKRRLSEYCEEYFPEEDIPEG